MVKKIESISKIMKGADIISLMNLASGMIAILQAVLLNFKLATLFILLAAIFDVLDGYVAKKTKTTEFGAQLDSLCDMVSFGVAPAIICVLAMPGRFSVFVALIFVMSGALRLARYNILNLKKVFMGMPIPIAALLFSVGVWVLPNFILPWLLLVLAFLKNTDFKVKRLW